MSKMLGHSALYRQWELLKLIPSRGPGLTAHEITQKLHDLGLVVSKRTVERDLQELSLLFGLYCNESSKPYGWRWLEGTSVDLPSLTLADAVSLHLVEEFIRPLLPAAVLSTLEPRFSQAAKKLSHLANTNSIARWKDKIALRSPAQPLLPPCVDRLALETVQDALLNEKQLEAEYHAVGTAEVKSILLHPLGLVQRGAATYLVATAFHYSDVRLYAVHRIQAAKCLQDKVSLPEQFSLDEYIDQGAMEFGSGDTIQLKGKIHKDVAFYLRETPLSEDMLISGQGDWLDITATVLGTWQLKWWIMSYASQIEIIEPQYLRASIKADLEAALNLYAD